MGAARRRGAEWKLRPPVQVRVYEGSVGPGCLTGSHAPTRVVQRPQCTSLTCDVAGRGIESVRVPRVCWNGTGVRGDLSGSILRFDLAIRCTRDMDRNTAAVGRAGAAVAAERLYYSVDSLAAAAARGGLVLSTCVALILYFITTGYYYYGLLIAYTICQHSDAPRRHSLSPSGALVEKKNKGQRIYSMYVYDIH